MNPTIRRAINVTKRAYQRFGPLPSTFGMSYDSAQMDGQVSSDYIRTKLLGPLPVMIGRFGFNELACVLNYCAITNPTSSLKKTWNYIEGRSLPFWWDRHIVESMCNNAGFFPPSIELLARFSALMLEDMEELDVLGSWMKEEQLVMKYMPNVVKVQLPDLEPYYHAQPWSTALAGKRVLVVHPYDETIRSQYAKRKLLFANPDVLPEFDLVTLRAVQSIANNKTNYADWFEAFSGMKDQISSTEFDVAIIGCGAYGFPLAAHVKRLGRKAVHLGGATQVLFGIQGKRWDDIAFFQEIINEHWARPSTNEVPQNHATVEEGCYW
jgi:hypothetical protein